MINIKHIMAFRKAIAALSLPVVLVLALSLVAPPGQVTADRPASLDQRRDMPAATQSDPALTGAAIIAKAHQAAGGTQFLQPGTLILTGYNLIRRGAEPVIWDRYAMWRSFVGDKTDAHSASGKVRIEGWTNGSLALLLAFDGTTTYTDKGPMQDTSANAMWASNFGFGAIRHALDDGWLQTRKPDRLIDGQPTYMVMLIDPSGGETLFGIRIHDHALVYVGFNTPRGWHERRYSNFFQKPGINWQQPGRVRLYYNGVKTNEAIWTDFTIGTALPDSLFTVTNVPETPSF